MIPLRLFSPHAVVPIWARLLLTLLRRIRSGHLTLVCPDGTVHAFGDSHSLPHATLHVRDWRACRRILHAGDIGFAEAYRAGWVDSPDLVALIRLAIRNLPSVAKTAEGSRIASLWYHLRHRLRANSRTGSRRNIHAHYDLGNAFYSLWLDKTWTYSSAWFEGDDQRSLADAQHAKYQRIIDTLGLRAGERVLEIGCGWGGFALHAARQGIAVHGITISQAQYAIAKSRIDAETLGHLAEISLTDYRDVQGQFAAIVSIEMFEAVGEAYWPTFFSVLKSRLLPGGRALIQSITIDDNAFDAYRTSSDFIREYIFPGGMLPSAGRFVRASRDSGMSASQTLSFGRDYARTLRLWHEAFESQIDTVRAQGFDDTFVRTWRLYLQYCEAAFEEQRIDVRHFLVTHGE
ncbi:SAM-dependent methyltransferase [Pandoraea apista]|uniref:Class I SAM-dependent methyltransferase n=1 Tax=Pandoraea apista TaxID=93218 RepID=A0ABX9ZKW4_9BURK|nr:cyclopropane-fatty-acyl-phospholipid synthase family protein [Pandoraea apista]PTE00557.1 SAM-dependent methyltransferase [Pandoraea apista]RRJ27471.1 class I SAM-dependent methyltransferase [Pandoraea apista]RRJ79582.1 class I SAM-dependent methyltransferase [Pandoraea apista]RSC99800.1 class I SAM-dependent methyltransferase [Pandoraea apista]RSD18017.1 class I SAM-dependent methyltransferase [Pandoraea apista]